MSLPPPVAPAPIPSSSAGAENIHAHTNNIAPSATSAPSPVDAPNPSPSPVIASTPSPGATLPSVSSVPSPLPLVSPTLPSSGGCSGGVVDRHGGGFKIVIDLEPARKRTPRCPSQLQSLPDGDVKLLCDTVVESVRELTGYDRVMVYKFHEDEHGEVVSESKRPDLKPYIGLHYPATDIPQASRVVQDEALVQPLCLVGSTLRATHGCHAQYMANMGSIASLVMAVIINGSSNSSSEADSDSECVELINSGSRSKFDFNSFSGFSSYVCDGDATPMRPRLGDLPESCVALLLMYLDPPDICMLARLSKAFRDASLAYFIWESKLPLNYKFIVDKALKDVSVQDSGKRDIYARLCRPNLFDNGTKEIWLDKRMGGMCMAISSQALRITGIDDT
ncbi:unnamed protein product [Sphenostylis stenocarpa]|uniref:F-box domain-containing protein n=1 Tax=Sphenostylis stenocarpa TaxID=92480 RepID=A0AA86W457_9FABA|nr:unnamed protein product [Sphenostylis stenocarpa]